MSKLDTHQLYWAAALNSTMQAQFVVCACIRRSSRCDLQESPTNSALGLAHVRLSSFLYVPKQLPLCAKASTDLKGLIPLKTLAVTLPLCEASSIFPPLS
eukprot:6208915-Pleurochrysis_carterae.AAC.2